MTVTWIASERHGCHRTANCLVCVHGDLSDTGLSYWDVVPVDYCLENVVNALNAAGILTKACCCGHGLAPGNILLHDGTSIMRPQCTIIKNGDTEGTEMDEQVIADRVRAREHARFVAEFLVEENDRLEPAAREVFWNELKRALLPKIGTTEVVKAAGPPPFTDDEAKNFGRTLVPHPFRKYQGDPVDGVPLKYLENLCEPNPFIEKVRRYLASTRILLESEDPNCD